MKRALQVLGVLGVLAPITLWGAAFFALGFGAGQTWPGITAPEPRALSKDEWINFSLIERTVPMTVRLEIEDKAAFESPGGWNNAQARMSEAYTYVHRSPCEIHLRAGAMIVAHPARHQAYWASNDDGDTIAHELLHCIRGDWHK